MLRDIGVLPGSIEALSNLNSYAITLNSNEESIQRCIVGIDPNIVYPNLMMTTDSKGNKLPINVNVTLIQTSLNVNFGDDIYQSV